MYYRDNDGYQNFLYFAPILNSLILDSNEKVTKWISTGISSEKIKRFDAGREPTMSSLTNGSILLQFNNSVSVQKSLSSMCSNFILSFYKDYELNNWPRNLMKNFSL